MWCKVLESNLEVLVIEGRLQLFKLRLELPELMFKLYTHNDVGAIRSTKEAQCSNEGRWNKFDEEPQNKLSFQHELDDNTKDNVDWNLTLAFTNYM